MGMRRYRIDITDEDGVVVQSARTNSAFMAWHDPDTDVVRTWGDLSPAFALRLITEHFGGVGGAVSKIGALLSARNAKTPA